MGTIAQRPGSSLAEMESRVLLRHLAGAYRDYVKYHKDQLRRAEPEATAMVDRYNKMFIRTLRALRDLRRYAPSVVIQNAGQVNVGSQQVNVAPRRRRRRNLTKSDPDHNPYGHNQATNRTAKRRTRCSG
jgi:hypothetical protein